MEEVEVVIVMDYSLPLDLPIAVIPYLSSAGRQNTQELCRTNGNVLKTSLCKPMDGAY